VLQPECIHSDLPPRQNIVPWLPLLLKLCGYSSCSLLSFPLAKSPLLYCDNLSAMALSTNLIMHSRAKHIEVDCHFVREKVTRGEIQLQHVSSSQQVADILTKGLCSPQFDYHGSNLMLNPLSHELA
ncbi:unnamed protein product, partial [Prunus brigantina]